MNAAEEQVLEHALEEILGEGETELAERVLRRLREQESEEARPVGPRREGPRRRLLWAAAAALLAASLWLFDWFRDDASPASRGVIATADAPLEVLRPGDPRPVTRSEFHLGETLVNGPGGERRIELASGATVQMGPCTMLTLESAAAGVLLEPRVGVVTVRAPSISAPRIRTSLGTLTLNAPGTLRVEGFAEGYTLEEPVRFRRLAQEIHMKTALPLVLTTVALLQGSATLESPSGIRNLSEGESIRQAEPERPVAGAEALLLREVGTWDLVMTHIGPDGSRQQTLEGVEVCRAGPGEKWLLSEQTVTHEGREMSVMTVVGYEARKQRYTGSLADSFGGEIGILKGSVDLESETRTLEMYSADGTPGFEARMTMRWTGEDERVTELEAMVDGDWILVREIVHRRRVTKDRER